MQVSILTKSVATKFNLAIQHSIKICPFGSKPYSVKGKYKGSVTYGITVLPSTWYVIDKSGTELCLFAVKEIPFWNMKVSAEGIKLILQKLDLFLKLNLQLTKMNQFHFLMIQSSAKFLWNLSFLNLDIQSALIDKKNNKTK